MKQLLLVVLLLAGFSGAAQRKTKNLVIVTLDGLRWQEIFTGADSALISDEAYTRDIMEFAGRFWAASAPERRAKLFPFLWTTVAEHGRLYGNRFFGNKMDNANPYWFSYPGYNEIFTGYPDTTINSNDKIYNRNTNVLEFLNQQKGFKGKVAVFTTWDVFPYILNAPRSGIYVNADIDTLKFPSAKMQLINDIQFLTPKPIGVRPDVLTYIAAREYLEEYKPRVLYIAFDETDDFAHAGMYDQYLESAHAEDRMIKDLWHTLQSLPHYRGTTTLLITCDHGRGDKTKADWQHHGSKIEDAGQIWMAVMGPDTPAGGEMKNEVLFYQAQLATTIAALLGFQFQPDHPVMTPLPLTTQISQALK